ncbi:MAG: carboxypeptidase-like regulatory domain-containing protein, partial [Paramuribaculum sp.]|nr:carboxypeptidase-like regulatory domain-containing protein [Paramuribaculum sp.]
MKTRLFLAAAVMMLMAAASPAVAQQTGDGKQAVTRVVKGAVIDKNGNPIPGATVRATGGAEVTVTDADGTYSIEVPVWLKSLTASYTGMMDKKIKLTPAGTTIFTLKPERGQTYGFINLVGTQVWQVKSSIKGVPAQTQLGIMGGAYRNWGGY